MKSMVLAAVSAAMFAAPVSAATVADAGFQSPSNSNVAVGLAFPQVSQSFVQVNDGQLVSVGAYLTGPTSGVASGSFDFSIASRTAGQLPSAWTILGTMSFDAADLGAGSANFAWFDFDVSSLGLVGSAGSLWGLVLDNAQFSSGFVAWSEAVGTDATYADGEAFGGRLQDTMRLNDLSFRTTVDTSVTVTPSEVPLPASLPILMAGLGGLAFLRRRVS